MSLSQNEFFKNVSWLFVVQLTNQVLPLFTIPYLSRMLGVETYGVLALCVSIYALANVLTDFGFDLWATAEVARRRDDVHYINELITSILLIKAVLLACALGVIVLYAFFTNKYAVYRGEILLTMLPLLALTYTPTWLFQGLERIGFIAVPALIAKILYIVCILTLVTSADDVGTILTVMGATQALVVGVAIVVIYRFGYALGRPNAAFIFNTVRESATFFWSRAAVSTYTSGGALFIGLVGSPHQLGLYSTAEQLYRGLQSLASPLSQAIYPKMVRDGNFNFLYRVTAGVAALSLAGALMGIWLSPFIVELVFGTQFSGSAVVLNVFLFTFVFSATSSLLGYPLFGALKRLELANRSVFFAALIQLLLLLFIYYFGAASAFAVALSVLVVEMAVLGLRTYWGVTYGPPIRLGYGWGK